MSNNNNDLFDRLSDNPHEALQIYQRIYRDLLFFFAQRAVDSPDDLASETIKRVIENLATGKAIVFHKGDEGAYFFGFAKNVLREFHRKRPPFTPMDELPENSESDADSPGIITRIQKQREMKCVMHCFARLPKEEQDLLEEYYQEPTAEKSAEAARKLLADSLGITPNALKLRVARIRKKLAECKNDCMQKAKLRRQSLSSPG